MTGDGENNKNSNMSQRPVSPSIMNSADNSGPPGHFYVAVASRMVIPQTLNIEQVAIILMKAKKALQQLQFQWVVLNRPACNTFSFFF